MFPEICVSGAARGVRGKSAKADLSPDEKDKFMLRFPEGLRREVKSAALANRRSMNSEIVHRLLQFSDASERVLPIEVNTAGITETMPSPAHNDGSGSANHATRYSDALEIVRLALDVFGREAAQALWRDFGLPLPPSRPPRQRQVSEAQMRVEAFLDECTIPDPLFRLAFSELHARYRHWMELQGQPPLEVNAFGKLLGKAGCKRRRSNGSFYLGLRLKVERDA